VRQHRSQARRFPSRALPTKLSRAFRHGPRQRADCDAVRFVTSFCKESPRLQFFLCLACQSHCWFCSHLSMIHRLCSQYCSFTFEIARYLTLDSGPNDPLAINVRVLRTAGPFLVHTLSTVLFQALLHRRLGTRVNCSISCGLALDASRFHYDSARA
jgi:hypothetical protein